jgi:hypothetical protein
MKGNTSRRVLGVVMASLLLFSGAAAAAQFNVTSGVEYTTDSGLTVTAGEDHTISDDPFKGPETVVVNNVLFSASSKSNVTADDFLGDYTNLSAIDAGSVHILIDPEDKPSINVSGGVDAVDFRDPTVDDSTVDFVYSASSTAYINVSTSFTNTQIAAVDKSTGTIIDRTTTDGAGRAVFDQLDSGSHEIVLKTTAAPSLSDPEPNDGEKVSTSPVELAINVSDADFADTDDSVTVKFYNASDDTKIGSETLTSNGTANVSWNNVVAGPNQWYVKASDAGNQNTTSSDYTTSLPDAIEIRSEQTLNLLDGVNEPIEVQFYPDDADDATVYTRSTKDGRISMTGLPVNTDFTVRADVDSYEPREIYIDSIIDQSTIYLSNASTADLVLNEFTLTDQSGQFPSSSTKIYIERALNTTGSANSEYQTIAGGYFGANEEFSVALVRGQRYRLVVENDNGQRRELGAYTADTAGPVPLQIGEIRWPQPDTKEWIVSTSADSGVIDIKFNDPADQTDELDLRVYERGNESNLIYEDTISDPSQHKVSVSQPQTDTEWIVEYNVTRSGTTTTNRVPVGSDSAVLLPAPQSWVTALSLLGIVVLAAAFPGTLSAIGGVVTVAAAGILMLLGWLTIPATSWFVAATIAVFGVVQKSNQTTI